MTMMNPWLLAGLAVGLILAVAGLAHLADRLPTGSGAVKVVQALIVLAALGCFVFSCHH